MGSFSIWHWLIVLAVVLLLFGGKNKISALMGDFGKGLSAFKKGAFGRRCRQGHGAGGSAGRFGQADLGPATTSSPSQAHQDNTAKV